MDKWNVASFDCHGVARVLSYPCNKGVALDLANELNRWMLERPHWKVNATYLAYPVPFIG